MLHLKKGFIRPQTTSNNLPLIWTFISHVNDEFATKDLGQLNYDIFIQVVLLDAKLVANRLYKTV